MSEDEWPVVVGDEVVVLYGYGMRQRASAGTVKVIGPKHITVVETNGRISRFLRDTRERSDGAPGSMETLPQHADRKANTAARETLRDNGVTVEHSKRWGTQELTWLAKVVVALRLDGEPS
jgi:hypothetical protein